MKVMNCGTFRTGKAFLRTPSRTTEPDRRGLTKAWLQAVRDESLHLGPLFALTEDGSDREVVSEPLERLLDLDEPHAELPVRGRIVGDRVELRRRAARPAQAKSRASLMELPLFGPGSADVDPSSRGPGRMRFPVEAVYLIEWQDSRAACRVGTTSTILAVRADDATPSRSMSGRARHTGIEAGHDRIVAGRYRHRYRDGHLSRGRPGRPLATA